MIRMMMMAARNNVTRIPANIPRNGVNSTGTGVSAS